MKCNMVCAFAKNQKHCAKLETFKQNGQNLKFQHRIKQPKVYQKNDTQKKLWLFYSELVTFSYKNFKIKVQQLIR